MKNTTVRLALAAAALLFIGAGLVRAQGGVQAPVKIGNAKINTNVRLDVLPKIDLLEARLAKLEANNAALKEEVEALQKQANQSTKDMVAAKLVIGGLDKSLGDLKTNYAKHTHTIPFGFSNPATVVNSPNPILVPWISASQAKGSFRTDGPTK